MNAWDQWKQEHIQQQRKAEAAAAPAPKQGKEPPPRRPITQEELHKVQQLQKVSTSWGTGDRRFIDGFEDATAETTVTERQAWWISCLFYKYRKQLCTNPPRPAGYRARGDW